MTLFRQVIVTFVTLMIIGFTSAIHNCSSFNDRVHGFGCELRNVEPKDEKFEIMMMSSDSNKTDADVSWLQIRESKLEKLPGHLFERFVNMEKIMIITSTGFQTLDDSYFDGKLQLILMKQTDLEVIGENAFKGLYELLTISLNYNNIKKVHEYAFRDLTKVTKIEMVFNKIEYLHDDTFANNVNLKTLLLYSNKLKAIPAKLFSRNTALDSLQLQNNSIVQIEKGFADNLKSLVKVDFSSNLCISEIIILSRYIQWSSHIYKFKDCFHNFALLKSTNEVVDGVQKKIELLEAKVDDTIKKVDNDLRILETKMENSTDLQNFETNLISFFKEDQERLKKNYEADLKNISSGVQTEIQATIEKKIIEIEETKQEKLVDHREFDQLEGKFTFIYFSLFFLICIIVGLTLIISRKVSIFTLNSKYQSDRRELIEA